MNKKIPSVFANRIDKKIVNNSTYCVTRSDEVIKKGEIDINSKINNIFKSTGYIYKINVEIVMKDKTIIKKVIGKKNGYLITIDNERININDIVDINVVN